MVKNTYYHSPQFDLKSWTIHNIDTNKCKWGHAKEVINYFFWKFGRDLTVDNCTRPSSGQIKKLTLAEF